MAVRYYVTENLQKNELGILTLGQHQEQMNGFGIALPPQMSSFNLPTYCDKNNLKEVLNSTFESYYSQ